MALELRVVVSAHDDDLVGLALQLGDDVRGLGDGVGRAMLDPQPHPSRAHQREQLVPRLELNRYARDRQRPTCEVGRLRRRVHEGRVLADQPVAHIADHDDAGRPAGHQLVDEEVGEERVEDDDSISELDPAPVECHDVLRAVRAADVHGLGLDARCRSELEPGRRQIGSAGDYGA